MKLTFLLCKWKVNAFFLVFFLISNGMKQVEPVVMEFLC